MKSADKHSKIIHAAIKVFAKKGFFNARVSDIAREAKVADGTIYLYFLNKFDILLSVFEQEIGVLITDVSTLLAQEEDVRTQLDIFIRHHLEAMHKHRFLAEVIHVELRQTSKLIREYRKNKFIDYLDILETIIVRGQKVGIFQPEIDPRLTKYAFFGALDETSRLWLRNGGVSTEEAMKQLSLLFQNALSGSSQ